MEKLVLIIDDDPVYLKFMQSHFGLLKGFITEIYSTGEAALTKLASVNPFLVILDHQLSDPSKDGFFYLKEIRKRNSKIPVIYITADTSPSLKHRAEKFGVHGFIYKNEAFLVYLRTALDDLLRVPKKKNIFRKLF